MPAPAKIKVRPDHGEVRYWGGTAWPGR